MFDSVFMQILDMSKTASIVIAVVLVARLLLKKAPKWISYALWAVVLLRLLCPISVEAPVSAVPRMESVSDSYTLAEEPISVAGAAEAATQAVGDALNGGLGVQHIRTTDKAEDGEDIYTTSLWWEVWVLFGQYVWLAGIAVMLIYSAVSYIKLRRRLVGAIPLRDNIYLADRIDSPFVMGLIRPKIYLPSSIGEREQEYIILHEQRHICRLDHVIKVLAFAALCLHWFNPLVWLAFVLAGKDMEMSCDESVIKTLGSEIRADYSASLLSLATGRRLIAGTPLAFGEGDTRSRIKNLAKWKKPVIWIVIIAVLLCAVLAVCLLTDPVDKGDIITLTERKNDSSIHIEYDLDIGEAVKSGTIVAEVWANGECVQSAPVTFTRFAKKIDLHLTPRRENDKYSGVDVQITTDQYGGSLLTYFALPEYSGGLGWATMAREKDEDIALEPGTAKMLAAVAFDLGNGVRGLDCETLEKEPERLKQYEYIIVIMAGFNAEELAPQATSEASSSPPKEVLQLNHVVKLAEKGYELGWADFENFDYIETGSGLYIRVYEIDETFSLHIGGSSPNIDRQPMYIYLIADDLDTRIDIRDGGVEEFIENIQSEKEKEQEKENIQAELVDKNISYRLANLKAEDIKEITGAMADIDTSKLVKAMNAAAAVDYNGDFRGYWNIDVYTTSGDENFRLYAGLEENIVQMYHHTDKSNYSTCWLESKTLYELIRGSFTYEGEVERQALAEHLDIIEARAQESLRQSEEAVGALPFVDYEITEFREYDHFENGNELYTVYKWDVAFIPEDPDKVAWAGGMWMDGDFRVRAYELDTYFVVRSLDGDMVDYQFMGYDMYVSESSQTDKGQAWSDIQLAWRRMEIENFINAMPNNGLLNSFYENVWEADLYQLIYQCVDESVAYESVREAYEAEIRDVHTDLSYISRDNLNKLLLRLTGYGLGDKQWNFGNTQYFESIDVYCIMHGDTNYDPFVLLCTSWNGDTVTCTLRSRLADASENASHTITLREVNGVYQFVSCREFH